MSLGSHRRLELALQHNQIGIDAAGPTATANRPGIFAIGDVVTYPRQAEADLTGFAEAAIRRRASAFALVPSRNAAANFEIFDDSGVPSI